VVIVIKISLAIGAIIPLIMALWAYEKISSLVIGVRILLIKYV
jgi:hypothetical protein